MRSASISVKTKSRYEMTCRYDAEVTLDPMDPFAPDIEEVADAEGADAVERSADEEPGCFTPLCLGRERY